MRNFPLPVGDLPPINKQPTAVLSGNLIHILYPNGEVEAIATDLMGYIKSKLPLDNCTVWGYIGYV